MGSACHSFGSPFFLRGTLTRRGVFGVGHPKAVPPLLSSPIAEHLSHLFKSLLAPPPLAISVPSLPADSTCVSAGDTAIRRWLRQSESLGLLPNRVGNMETGMSLWLRGKKN